MQVIIHYNSVFLLKSLQVYYNLFIKYNEFAPKLRAVILNRLNRIVANNNKN